MQMQHINTGLQTPDQDIHSDIPPEEKQPGRHTDQASAMASHVTTAGEFVIVTHKYPLSSAGQAAPGTVASQLPGPMQTFLRGQPKALGVVQIMIGIISLLFGPALMYADTSEGIIGLPFWTGVWYIISGSLAVAAENTHRRDLVKACLGMNVVSSVFAGVGSILYSISVSIVSFRMDYLNRSADYYDQISNHMDYLNRSAEYDYLRRYSLTIYVGILAVLLVLNILEMCIAIATSAFGCKSECSYTAMPVVAFQQA
ncbi:membrane-spanning 4-domains subfamily A member 4A-like [Acipenser oxyrinchus oxyrinchus]|uniref:Membrane-spanning 4-domains subfamily A member 4A-like n=1 Tax=Acipenser oxyrinchus oxyrinchus TaxID=40147 RepID=A0AAD8CM84_ACIOX|nr:membrane-spanning 4-domains subfamily A member 4A-like [Acipenser oxyrinchus oxyrinchus]